MVFDFLYSTKHIDPYDSFVTNALYVILLISTSLFLNTINGIVLIKMLYNSLKYLDSAYCLITTIPQLELKSLKKNTLRLAKDIFAHSKFQLKSHTITKGKNERSYSKECIKIKKPMFKLSFAIIVSIIILSCFYVFSLYFLEFFSGDVST
jgi:hypothetical protein